MFNLLNKHERTHGLFYKQFAKKVQKSLRRMKPASSCRSLDRQAKAIVKQLGLEDKERNNRFDRRDQRNYRRMSMLYRGS